MTHPIIPSADLILQWRTQWQNDNEEIEITNLIYQAARWGGDQELEACCDWLESNQCIDPEETVQRLYDERRANCLTIKEQALHALEVLEEEGHEKKSYDLQLEALEGLPD